MATSVTVRLIIAVLYLPRRIGDIIKRTRTIFEATTTNQPAAVPPTMAAHITDLEDAQDEAGLHTAGAVQVRNEKLAITKQDLKYLKHNVQLKADADLPNAESIITLCGLHIKKTAVVNKESFSVAHGQVSGQILLSAKSKGPRTANEWQMSDDGIVWTVLPSTLKAKTTVDGLTPPDKKYFRHRSLTKDGYTGWSAVLSIIVL